MSVEAKVGDLTEAHRRNGNKVVLKKNKKTKPRVGLSLFSQNQGILNQFAGDDMKCFSNKWRCGYVIFAWPGSD